MNEISKNYDGREQTAAKHLVLTKYLEKLAYKVGFSEPNLTLNYIDGFAGPWESNVADLSDTSPWLALSTLLKVKEGLANHGKNIHIRGFFVSPNKQGVEQLHELRKRFVSAEIEIAESKFEGALDRARAFAQAGQRPFAFIFIDPTGWTGLGLKAISPLLRDSRNEVLINFMTGHIVRFIDSHEKSFDELFGDPEYRKHWDNLKGHEREEKIVETYCKRVAEAAGYKYCVSTRILNPESDRIHFDLVYGTRNDIGLLEFRRVEGVGVEFQRKTRANVQQKIREEKSNQSELFRGAEIEAHTFEDTLRNRYVSRAKTVLEALMVKHGVVSWDELVLGALQIPMISESDVKEWLKGAQQKGWASVEGLAHRQRVPEFRKGNRVRWLRP
jgi:three-Cys-motif partner protein